MDRTSMRVGILVFALAAGASAFAQSPTDGTDQAVRDFEAWIEAIADYVKDVEIDEGYVRRVLELWPEFEALQEELPEWDDESPEALQVLVDWALEDPTYRGWTAKHGLNGEGWLRKTMRLQALLMREQLADHREDYDRISREQKTMVEEQCKQVDEATCTQMRQALRTAERMAEAIEKAASKLPTPTQREKTLLDDNREELIAMMQVEEDPDDGYEDEYYEEREEEDEEP